MMCYPWVGSLRLMTASHFSLTGVYDASLSFKMNARTMYVKWSVKNVYLCGEIWNPNRTNALKRFFNASKCWSVFEKTIASSVIMLYLSLFRMFSNILSVNSYHIVGEILRPISSLRKKYVGELHMISQWLCLLPVWNP